MTVRDDIEKNTGAAHWGVCVQCGKWPTWVSTEEDFCMDCKFGPQPSAERPRHGAPVAEQKNVSREERHAQSKKSRGRSVSRGVR